MGCWNGSCALTGLPIFDGDEVVVLFLSQQPLSMQDNNCDATTYWSPLSYHFTGKYNDYGAVESCEGPLLNHIIDTIKENLAESEDVQKATFDIDQLFKAEHNNGLALVSKWKHTIGDVTQNFTAQRLQHIIIRKSVFDAVISQYGSERFSGERYTYENILAVGMQLVDDAFRFGVPGVEDLADMNYEDMTPEQQGRFLLSLRSFHLRDDPKYRTFSSISHVLRYPELFMWDLDIRDAVETKNRELAEAIVDQVAKMNILSRYMQDSRRMWTPMSGDGSQNDSTEAHKLMAQITLDTAKQIDNRWDENNED